MIQIHTFMAERLPPHRDLTRAELMALASELGQAPKLWSHHVRHDPGERIYTQLYRDTHLDVWMICWLDDQKTGYHDHDLSSGAVYVCSGTLVEDRFHLRPEGLVHASRKRRAGESFEFDAAYIHGVRHAGGPPATSIHCYSPPLWRMGFYEPDGQGNLCRTSLTYLDEVGDAHTHS